jgi:hypothetical protein
LDAKEFKSIRIERRKRLVDKVFERRGFEQVACFFLGVEPGGDSERRATLGQPDGDTR